MVDFTLSSLLRRKGKNVSLLTVYTAVVFVLVLGPALDRRHAPGGPHILDDSTEIIVQEMAAGRHDLIPLPTWSDPADQSGQPVKERLRGAYHDRVGGEEQVAGAGPLRGRPGEHRHREGDLPGTPGV